METVRPNIKLAIGKSTSEELLMIYKHKNYETKLTFSEQRLVEQKICEHCKFHSFAYNKCEASLATMKQCCLLKKNKD